MTKTDNKTYTCNVHNKWMWSIESAMISITSPSGGAVIITKNFMNPVSDMEKSVILQCAEVSGDIELTIFEMDLLLSASKKIKNYITEIRKR